MHIFCMWKVLAFSIQLLIVVEMGIMDKFIVAIPWSTPRENWSIKVMSLVMAALLARF